MFMGLIMEEPIRQTSTSDFLLRRDDLGDVFESELFVELSDGSELERNYILNKLSR